MSTLEVFSPKLLRSKRLNKGLSIAQLSKLAMLRVDTISNFENGTVTPSVYAWSKLRRVLNTSRDNLMQILNSRRDNMHKTSENEDDWTTPKETVIHKPVVFSFENGKCYVIRERSYGGQNRTDINPASGKKCIFRYKGKDGIHHCFVEISGGWSRTFTEAQLIGKIIKEVPDEQTSNQNT